MPSEYISESIRRVIAARARGRCEYCCSPESFATERFSVEHVYPRAAGGQTTLDNLAWSCLGCNGHKHAKTEAIDPTTGQRVPLFNPRQQVWQDHMTWSSDQTHVIGITPCGRATVDSLFLNRTGVVNLRSLLLMAKLHPSDES
jgi:HNH endonuclease